MWQEEYDLDEEMRQASRRKRGGKKEEAPAKPLDLDADITPEEMQMMQTMGIPFVGPPHPIHLPTILLLTLQSIHALVPALVLLAFPARTSPVHY